MDEFYHFIDIDREGAYALVEAVVKSAIRDWKSAMRVLQKQPNSYQAEVRRVNCETFFMSDYFYMLTGTDGNLLLDRLEEEFDNAC